MKGKTLQIGMIVLSLAIIVGGYAVWRHFNPVPCHKDVDCAWDAFQHIAFGSEYDPSALNFISKWDEPIYLAVYSNDESRHVPMVERYIELIQPHLPYPITLLNTHPNEKNGFNILVIFSDDFDRDLYETRYEQLNRLYTGANPTIFEFYEEVKAQNAQCAGLINVNSDNYAKFFATLLIPSYNSQDLLWSCINEEITQSFGLPNDYKGFPSTMFNDMYGYCLLYTSDAADES